MGIHDEKLVYALDPILVVYETSERTFDKISLSTLGVRWLLKG